MISVINLCFTILTGPFSYLSRGTFLWRCCVFSLLSVSALGDGVCGTVVHSLWEKDQVIIITTFQRTHNKPVNFNIARSRQDLESNNGHCLLHILLGFKVISLILHPGSYARNNKVVAVLCIYIANC